MPGPDWIPGVSQLKAALQLITGDFEGFARTLENFVKECPGVSQVTSVLQLVAGDLQGALETQKRCLGTVSNVMNIFPVVGHVKGVVHIIVGDLEGGCQALNAATRSTVIFNITLFYNAKTFMGAFICGSIAGVGYDIAATLLTRRTQGSVAVIRNAIENPSAGTIFDAAVIPPGYGLYIIAWIVVPQIIFGIILVNALEKQIKSAN